jgi:hypothetical protein
MLGRKNECSAWSQELEDLRKNFGTCSKGQGADDKVVARGWQLESFTVVVFVFNQGTGGEVFRALWRPSM